jgi:cell filamentation protein
VTDSRDAFSGLNDPLRHAVCQVIAAQQLEGWQPSSRHVTDLVAVATRSVTFGEYLSRYRGEHAIAERENRDRSLRRVFQRRRPYLIPGTSVLRNNFGVADDAQLRELEFVCTAARMVQWHNRLIHGDIGATDLDVGGLHQHVFADVYAWAGTYRTTELRRGATAFAWQSSVPRAVSAVEHRARQVVTHSQALDVGGLAFEMSHLYAEYNRIHPFREGNGRAGTLLLHTLATLCGRRLDLAQVSRREWYLASRDSMPARRDGRASHRPFIPVFMRALR